MRKRTSPVAPSDAPTLNAVEVASKPRPPAALVPAIGRTCAVCGEQIGPLSDDSPSAPIAALQFCAQHRAMVMNSREVREKARELIERNAYRYAELHVAGAEIAAQRGDTRAAEWGLLHSRAVESVKGQSAGSGVVVQIGIALPGLGKDTKVAVLTAGEDDDDDDDDEVVEGEVV